jgi:septal ring factor EnvC (AmiA/AmiB activator)
MMPTMTDMSRDTTRRDASRQSSRDTTTHDTTNDRDELLEELRRDKAYLQDLLDRTLAQLAAERERADVLQLRAIGTGETSPEPASEPPGAPQTNETGPRGVWDRLREWLGYHGER